MLRPLSWAAVASTIAVLLGASDAAAWCRATTCAQSEGTMCDPATPDDCGKPLVWTRNCLGFAVQKSGSPLRQITADQARAYMRQAFLTWESAPCGGGEPPRVHVTDLGTVDCASVEYNDKGGNANVVVFRDNTWPHPSGSHNIALTTVTYDSQSGAIYDADMEINSAEYTLTTSDVPSEIQFDFLSVITHEAGHFLGLAHSQSDPTATMTAVYNMGSIDFRDLSADDVAAICDAYPPTSKGPIPDTCNPIPRHGYSPECLVNQREGSCTFAPPAGSAPDVRTVALALALGTWAARRRGRARPLKGRSGSRVT